MKRYLRCSPEIEWVKNQDHLLLVHRLRRQSWQLQDSQALIWELLCIGHRYEKLLQLFALIQSIDLEEAHREIQQTVQGWAKEGILEAVGEHS